MHMLCKIVCIMEMNHTFFMCFYYIFWKKESLCDILRNFTCHVVTLYAIYSWVLI